MLIDFQTLLPIVHVHISLSLDKPINSPINSNYCSMKQHIKQFKL